MKETTLEDLQTTARAALDEVLQQIQKERSCTLEDVLDFFDQNSPLYFSRCVGDFRVLVAGYFKEFPYRSFEIDLKVWLNLIEYRKRRGEI